MLYNFNGTCINVMEIRSLEQTNGNDPTHSFVLTVRLKDGSSYGVRYNTEEGRRREVYAIQDAVNTAFKRLYPNPLTHYDMEAMLEKEVKKIRTDIRAIKKQLDGTGTTK